jgi:hypothetical protein
MLPSKAGAFYLLDIMIKFEEQGLVAERLGRGLQNLVQRFESVRDLQLKTPQEIEESFLLFNGI